MRDATIDTRKIHSLTDFLRNYKAHIAQLKETRTPEVLTVNGRAEVVILDTETYESMVAQLNHQQEGNRRRPRPHGTGPQERAAAGTHHRGRDGAPGGGDERACRRDGAAWSVPMTDAAPKIVAVLDACVLYPPSLRDLLMWLGTVRAYEPVDGGDTCRVDTQRAGGSPGRDARATGSHPTPDECGRPERELGVRLRGGASPPSACRMCNDRHVFRRRDRGRRSGDRHVQHVGLPCRHT